MHLEPLRRVRISTRTFPENQRLAMWREVYGRGITGVDIEPIGDAPFHADVTFSLLPGVGIAAGSRSPAHHRVTRELARQGGDVIVLSMLRAGIATTSQFGTELNCGAGDASLLSPADPCTASLHSAGSFLTLALSRKDIAALVPGFASAFGHLISGDDAALRLLVRYLDSVLAEEEPTNLEVARSISTHILDLAALAIGARGEHAEMAHLRGAKVARLNAIRSDILQELGRDDLSSELIAARHGISPRYVRKLFEHDGSSFSSFVFAARLAKAQRMLADRRYAHLNIAQVAQECGFGDASYFNRVFRRRFGATPSDVRGQAQRRHHDLGEPSS
jgi:AraC-like DNA-binding protein